MKKKTFFIITFCAFICAFSIGCTNLPEEFSNPPPSVSAFEVSVDGESLGFVSEDSTKEDFKNHLCELKSADLTENGAEVKSVDFQKEIVFTPTEVAEEEIQTCSEIAHEFYGKDLNFEFILIEHEEKVLAFETVYQNSSSHYEGTQVTKTDGKNGSASLTYEAHYSGNEQLSRKLIEEKVTAASQNKVVLVGTKKSTASTGIYKSPLKNIYVTSSYGGRTLNGKYDFHYGVDFRAATGTSVYASDGGKVIYAATMGTYGKLVKIRHDNGSVTYYAHLSSISVKVGQRVYQGQVIAKSGATGNVTGPHLHFEIRINGKHTDPMKYL